MIKRRRWQERALKQIKDIVSNKSVKSKYIVGDIGAGMGKTTSITDLLLEYTNAFEKTVNVIACPSLDLCRQQYWVFNESYKAHFNNTQKTYKIMLVNSDTCDKQNIPEGGDVPNKFVLRDPNKNGARLWTGLEENLVFVYCAKTLFNDGERNTSNTYKYTVDLLTDLKKQGYKLCSINYDEAHNYEKNKLKMLELKDGGSVYKNPAHKNMVFKNLFDTSAFWSATPNSYILEVEKLGGAITIQATYREGVEDGYIVKPRLHVLTSMYKENNDDTETDKFLGQALINEVIPKELEDWNKENKLFRPVILCCCLSIEGASAVAKVLHNKNVELQQKGEKPLCHIIEYHSPKDCFTEEGDSISYNFSIDGEQCKREDAKNKLNLLDKNEAFPDDDLPIVITQVDMIAEGININSINAAIVSKGSPTEREQKSTRGVRNYNSLVDKTKDKVNNGHYNLYTYISSYEDALGFMKLFEKLGLDKNEINAYLDEAEKKANSFSTEEPKLISKGVISKNGYFVIFSRKIMTIKAALECRDAYNFEAHKNLIERLYNKIVPDSKKPKIIGNKSPKKVKNQTMNPVSSEDGDLGKCPSSSIGDNQNNDEPINIEEKDDVNHKIFKICEDFERLINSKYYKDCNDTNGEGLVALFQEQYGLCKEDALQVKDLFEK